MSAVDPQGTVRHFLHLHEPAYSPLLHYAALPLILTPELLHYLRYTFTPTTPWIAEADILLDENLCRQYSTYEQYLMRAPIRAYLLGEARQDFKFRLADASRLMLGYLENLERTRPYRNPSELQTQAWSAMVYIDDTQRGKVFEEIKEAFRKAGKRQAGGHANLIGKAELERLAQITEKLAPEMAQYTELLDYARQVRALIRNETIADERAFHAILGKDMPSAAELAGRKPRGMYNWSHERFLSDLAALERLFENRDFEKALPTAQQLSENCQKIKETAYPEVVFDMAVAYFWLGRILRMSDRIKEARKYFMEALSLFRSLDAKERNEVEREESLVRIELGECLLTMGQFKKTEVLFKEVIQQYERNHWRSDAASVMRRLGEVYLSMGNYERALASFMNAKANFQVLNDIRSEAMVLSQIGEVYIAMGDNKSALDTFWRAIAIFQKLNDIGFEAMVMCQIVMAQEAMGEHDAAQSMYHQALSKTKQISNPLERASTLIQLGKLCERLMKLEESVELFRLSVDIYHSLRDVVNEGKAQQNLVRLLNLLGRNEEARRELDREHDGEVESAMRSELLPEIQRLLNEINTPSTEPPRRLTIGDELERLGDPRRGVGLDENGLPDIDWVEIPGGSFIYQRGEKRELPAYWISRYPITNRQFQAFINDGGYREDRWWRNMKKPEAKASRWPLSNRPRTDVNWYEAVAFTRWLTARLGLQENAIRLPTEYEWEKAARGEKGLVYPWGEKYRSGFANINETHGEGTWHLEQTTAVGLYPHGHSYYGVEDMSGTIWEWCLNKYVQPDVILADTSGDSRGLRGGSWSLASDHARADSRDKGYPDARYFSRGFRVLSSVLIAVR